MGDTRWLFIASGLLGVFATGVTFWLMRRLWSRTSEIGMKMKLVASVLAAAAMFGLVGTLLGLVKVMGAIGGESVDPSQRARVLADGISEAINCTALGLATCVASVIAALLAIKFNKAPAR